MYFQEIIIAALILVVAILIRFLSIAKRENRDFRFAKRRELWEKRAAEEQDAKREELHLTLKTTKRGRTRLHLVSTNKETVMYSPAGYTKSEKALALGERVKNAKLTLKVC